MSWETGPFGYMWGMCVEMKAGHREGSEVFGLIIRSLQELDYKFVITVVDEWWGGRHMADKLLKLFFRHFNDTSFVVEEDGTDTPSTKESPFSIWNPIRVWKLIEALLTGEVILWITLHPFFSSKLRE